MNPSCSNIYKYFSDYIFYIYLAKPFWLFLIGNFGHFKTFTSKITCIGESQDASWDRMSRRKCLKMRFLVFWDLKNNFRGLKQENKLFLCKNKTFHLLQLISRMQLKLWLFWGPRNFLLDVPVSRNLLWLTYTGDFAQNRLKLSGIAKWRISGSFVRLAIIVLKI